MKSANSYEEPSSYNETTRTTNARYQHETIRQPHTTLQSNDVVILFVIITSLVVLVSAASVTFGLWNSKKKRGRLRKIVQMNSNDFLLYAQVAQQEKSSAPCKTFLPGEMPYTKGSFHPIPVPGYVQIVQLTHEAATEQNKPKRKVRSVIYKPRDNLAAPRPRPRPPVPGQVTPRPTTSAPAILSGLWKQRHLLTGNKDGLVDSFASLKKIGHPQNARSSLSDTSPGINAPTDQSTPSACPQCSSGSSLLVGNFPRKISCSLCRERAELRDVEVSTEKTIIQTTHVPETLPTPYKSPGRPKLSTFPDNHRRSCTPEVRAQLAPFRTMILASSSSSEDSSDSD